MHLLLRCNWIGAPLGNERAVLGDHRALSPSISTSARRRARLTSGRWKFRVDPCRTARSVEHVMAVSD